MNYFDQNDVKKPILKFVEIRMKLCQRIGKSINEKVRYFYSKIYTKANSKI